MSVAIIEEPRHLSADFLKEIGAVAFVMAQQPRLRERPVHSLPARIAPAAMARQLRLFYTPQSVPVGYLTWAWLNPESERRWIEQPDVPLHPSEWTDGDTLWLTDFVFMPGWQRRLWKHAQASLFADQTSVKALHRHADGATRKVSTWRRRAGGAWRIADTQWP